MMIADPYHKHRQKITANTWHLLTVSAKAGMTNDMTATFICCAGVAVSVNTLSIIKGIVPQYYKV